VRSKDSSYEIERICLEMVTTSSGSNCHSPASARSALSGGMIRNCRRWNTTCKMIIDAVGLVKSPITSRSLRHSSQIRVTESNPNIHRATALSKGKAERRTTSSKTPAPVLRDYQFRCANHANSKDLAASVHASCSKQTLNHLNRPIYEWHVSRFQCVLKPIRLSA
jgi:hypothetical protein